LVGDGGEGDAWVVGLVKGYGCVGVVGADLAVGGGHCFGALWGGDDGFLMGW